MNKFIECFLFHYVGAANFRQCRHIGHHFYNLCIHSVCMIWILAFYPSKICLRTCVFIIAVLLFNIYHFTFRFNHTPVIMASGRELCYVLLTGVCLCYVMTFIILARPTVIRCALLRVGLGLCLSLCYSAIFVKTNRISRIFNCGVKAVSRPIYTSPISQIAICLCTCPMWMQWFTFIVCLFVYFVFLFKYILIDVSIGICVMKSFPYYRFFFILFFFRIHLRHCLRSVSWYGRLVSVRSPWR